MARTPLLDILAVYRACVINGPCSVAGFCREIEVFPLLNGLASLRPAKKPRLFTRIERNDSRFSNFLTNFLFGDPCLLTKNRRWSPALLTEVFAVLNVSVRKNIYKLQSYYSSSIIIVLMKEPMDVRRSYYEATPPHPGSLFSTPPHPDSLFPRPDLSVAALNMSTCDVFAEMKQPRSGNSAKRNGKENAWLGSVSWKRFDAKQMIE